MKGESKLTPSKIRLHIDAIFKYSLLQCTGDTFKVVNTIGIFECFGERLVVFVFN